MTKYFLLIFSLINVLPLLAGDRVQLIDSLLTSLYNRGKINGSFLIAEKGKIIYENSFGFTDNTARQKINTYTVFELASLSKQFTAMGIVILKEKGLLAYDDKLSQYIPELSFYQDVTLRHLLHHTSGIPDYLEIMDSLWDKKKIAVNTDLIKLFAKHKPKALFKPNSKFEYSNTGYALLASIIEKVSGETYSVFLEKNIFNPLLMANTFVYNRRLKPRKLSNYALGYVYEPRLDKYFLPDDMPETDFVRWLDGITGDGTVNSTPDDLLKWDRALYTDKLVSAQGLEDIFTKGVLDDSSQTGYGFGWDIERTKEYGNILSHSGSWPGYVTYIERHVDFDKTIIILQNHEEAALPIKLLRNLLYGQSLQVEIERKEINLPEDILEQYTGVYELEKNYTISINRAGNKLSAQISGQNTFDIFPESENKFFFKVADAQLEFVKDATNKVQYLILHQNGNQKQAVKIK